MSRTKQAARRDGKRKGNNAPDRQRPDEENPTLTSKPKSEEETAEEKKEWEDAIKLLQHRDNSTPPTKPAPPKQLLTLVGAFLTSYGFDHTCRIYQLQCNTRSKLNGWDNVLGEKLSKTLPDLVELYHHGLQAYEEKQRKNEISSNDGENKLAPKLSKSNKPKTKEEARKKKTKAAKAETAQTSSSGSDADSRSARDSDVAMKDVPASLRLTTSNSSTSSASATSTSESDADDENDTAGLGATLRKPTAIEIVNPLKRKTPPSASSSSDSSSSEEEPAPKRAKKNVVESGTMKQAEKSISPRKGGKQQPSRSPESKSSSSSSESESTSDSSDSGSEEPIRRSNLATSDTPLPAAHISSLSDSDSSSSDSDPGDQLVVPKFKKLVDESKVSSDSSVTLVPTPTTSTSKDVAPSVNSSALSSSSSSSDSEEEPAPASQNPTSTDTASNTKKRKASASPSALVESITVTTHAERIPFTGEVTSTTATTKNTGLKPRAVPFSRISPNTPIPAALASNAYQPYDYAERAHQDLIVTKGKGFTKEKNKKKRGSYRGGVIDVGPGRAIRFDD
ncbi:MAG: hypothetical protein Q9168_007436 [Polycauliona sp. 1 TL-2023]